MSKENQKKLAVELRRLGLSYSEILNKVPVAKSTLSLWLSEIGKIDLKSFWVAGAALYWAEGNKQKEHNVSSRVLFSNSDPEMMAYFQKWVKYFCNVTEDELGYELYIHKNDNLNSVLDYWCELLKISKSNLKVRFKIGNTESYRKNKYENYKGLIRMTVLKSTDLNRRIMSWAKECNKQFKIYSEIV